MARSSGLLVQLTIAALLGAAGVTVFSTDPANVVAIASPLVGHTSHAACDIKGNISQTSGERIYHVPGQRYYAETKIDTRYGERWFCSEQEARQAGWRQSRV